MMTYATLKSSIQTWAADDTVSAVIDTIIDSAEARINRKLRIRPMERAISVALGADGTTAIPADFIAIRDFYLFDYSGAPPAGGGATIPYSLNDITNVQHLPVSSAENQFADFERHREPYGGPRSSGTPRIALVGDKFLVSPTSANAPNLGGMYYAKIASLDDTTTTNWLTDNAPDLLLYSGLREASVYRKDTANIQYWESKSDELLGELASEHRRARTLGSSLRPTLRVP